MRKNLSAQSWLITKLNPRLCALRWSLIGNSTVINRQKYFNFQSIKSYSKTTHSIPRPTRNLCNPILTLETQNSSILPQRTQTLFEIMRTDIVHGFEQDEDAERIYLQKKFDNGKIEEELNSSEKEEIWKENEMNEAMEIEQENVNIDFGSYEKENAKIREWYNYQIGVYNVYYVLSVLIVTIIAKFYLSLNRMYSLR